MAPSMQSSSLQGLLLPPSTKLVGSSTLYDLAWVLLCLQGSEHAFATNNLSCVRYYGRGLPTTSQPCDTGSLRTALGCLRVHVLACLFVPSCSHRARILHADSACAALQRLLHCHWTWCRVTSST